MATLDDILEQNTVAAEALVQVVELLNRTQERATSKDDKEDKDKGLFATLKKIAGAATAAVGAITGLASTALSFVQALNPGLAALFNQELQNLYATIGGALEPVIQTAIPIIRQLAAIFLDLSTELKPIIEELSSALGSVLIAVVRLVATNLKVWLTLLGPLAKLWAMQLNLVAQLVEVWTALLKAVIDTVSEFLSAYLSIGDVNDALKALQDWVYRVAGVIAQFAGRLLILFGMTDLLAKFKKNIQAAIDAKLAPKGGLVAAPQGASTGGVEDIAKRFAEKAFAAAAGSATKKPEVGLLEEIRDGLSAATKPMNFKQVIIDALGKFFPRLGEGVEKFVDALPTIVDESVSRVKNATFTDILFGGVGNIGFNAGDIFARNLLPKK